MNQAIRIAGLTVVIGLVLSMCHPEAMAQQRGKSKAGKSVSSQGVKAKGSRPSRKKPRPLGAKSGQSLKGTQKSFNGKSSSASKASGRRAGDGTGASAIRGFVIENGKASAQFAKSRGTNSAANPLSNNARPREFAKQSKSSKKLGPQGREIAGKYTQNTAGNQLAAQGARSQRSQKPFFESWPEKLQGFDNASPKLGLTQSGRQVAGGQTMGSERFTATDDLWKFGNAGSQTADPASSMPQPATGSPNMRNNHTSFEDKAGEEQVYLSDEPSGLFTRPGAWPQSGQQGFDIYDTPIQAKIQRGPDSGARPFDINDAPHRATEQPDMRNDPLQFDGNGTSVQDNGAGSQWNVPDQDSDSSNRMSILTNNENLKQTAEDRNGNLIGERIRNIIGILISR